MVARVRKAGQALTEEQQPLEALSSQDRLVWEFIQECVKHDYHPEDAAKKVGAPITMFEALRSERPELEICWYQLEHKRKGRVRKPKDTLGIKHKLTNDVWKILGPRVVQAIARIPDSQEGDQQIFELLKHKIISQTMPSETVSEQKIEQTVEHKSAALNAKNNQELQKIALKNSAEMEEIQRQLDENKQRMGFLTEGTVTDAEFESGSGGESQGDGDSATETARP